MSIEAPEIQLARALEQWKNDGSINFQEAGAWAGRIFGENGVWEESPTPELDSLHTEWETCLQEYGAY